MPQQGAAQPGGGPHSPFPAGAGERAKAKGRSARALELLFTIGLARHALRDELMSPELRRQLVVVLPGAAQQASPKGSAHRRHGPCASQQLGRCCPAADWGCATELPLPGGPAKAKGLFLQAPIGTPHRPGVLPPTKSIASGAQPCWTVLIRADLSCGASHPIRLSSVPPAGCRGPRRAAVPLGGRQPGRLTRGKILPGHDPPVITSACGPRRAWTCHSFSGRLALRGAYCGSRLRLSGCDYLVLATDAVHPGVAVALGQVQGTRGAPCRLQRAHLFVRRAVAPWTGTGPELARL